MPLKFYIVDDDADIIAFMTAKADEIQKFKDLGALDVIPKPFDPMTLSDRIKAIWNGHHE